MKTCGYCGKEFKNAAGLSSHAKIKHGHKTGESVPIRYSNSPVWEINLVEPEPDYDPIFVIHRVKSVASEVGGLSALGEIVEALS